MSFFNDALDVLEKGATKATDVVSGAVSGVAIEQQAFMRGFIRMCTDGWDMGFHERNGGNLTYRMTEKEIESCKPFFDESGTCWTSMGVQADNLRGAYFVTTGAGRYLRNVQLDPAYNVGIVEINAEGDAWRIVWGLRDGGRPTSEFPSHFMIHSVRADVTNGECRVLYHAHPETVIALSKIMPLDARTVTRALWKAMTECIIAIPMGIGIIDWMVPGGREIALATCEQMRTYDAVIWAQHGLFCSGSDFDSAFGLMHTVEKSARIYAQAVALNGGSDEFPNTISDEGLRAIAQTYNLTINEDFLD